MQMTSQAFRTFEATVQLVEAKIRQLSGTGKALMWHTLAVCVCCVCVTTDRLICEKVYYHLLQVATDAPLTERLHSTTGFVSVLVP